MTTKRKATTLLLLDISGSMNGDRIRTAAAATSEFIARFSPQDRLGLWPAAGFVDTKIRS